MCFSSHASSNEVHVYGTSVLNLLCDPLASSFWRWLVDISKKVTNPYCSLLSVNELRHFSTSQVPSRKNEALKTRMQ